jgi:hypothetical protein
MERVQYAIEIVDRWGKPIKKLQSDVRSIDRMKVNDPFRDMPKSINQLRANLERYKRGAESTFRSDHLRKYNMLIGQTEKKIRMLESASQGASAKTRMLGGAMKMLPVVGAAGGIMMLASAVNRFGKESIMASAAFEKYGVTLRTMLGSQGAARERMSEYADIARKTPFQLRQIVEAGNQLQIIGRYSRSNVTMLGDLAAASGKPIEQVMNAYAKLSTGQKGEAVQMFRDLLISSQDWADATGKGIKKNGELAATTEEMIAALPKILQKKGFFGMMDQQAKTTEGQISNLGDAFDMLKVAVGDNMKPAFDRFLTGTTGIVEMMTRWVEVPVPEKIAREKAELNSLVGIITDANTGEERRFELLTQLKQEYPEFLKGINLETVKNEELRKKLEEVNGEYERKIKLETVKGLAGAEEQKLADLKLKREKLLVGLEARDKINELETFFKSRYKVYQQGGPSGTTETYEQAVERKVKEYNEKLINDPDNKEANEFLQAYADYKAQLYLAEQNNRFFDSQKKLKKIETEIAIQERRLSAYNKNAKKVEYQEILERAKKIDITDQTTFDELFGKKEIAGKFDALRQKAIKSFDKVSVDEWDKLASYLAGDLKWTKNTSNEPSPDGSPTPGGINIDEASATITGGGRMVKQVNIEIENLIGGEIINNFRDTDSIEDADDFLTQLSNALQSVVNDINMASV